MILALLHRTRSHPTPLKRLHLNLTHLLCFYTTMSLPRFYSDQDLSVDQTITLNKELAHYMQRVLRLPTQSQILLFNGQGGQYTAQIQYEGKTVQAQIQAFDPIERELPWRISIGQGLATGEKMDWICEKAVEMGATALIPIAAKHSTLKLSGERLEKRLSHWQRIAQAASEQCGRNRILHVDKLHSMAQLLQNLEPSTQLIFCDPDASIDFTEALQQAARNNQDHWLLLIGPEGGWSDEEKKMALDASAIAMRFGARVLRTETAAIALIGAIRGQLGWID